MPDRHPLRRIEAVLLVAIGGFAGSNLRYLAELLAPGMPGILAANVLGSFALGLVLYYAIHEEVLAAETRAIVATGFLSSFTTYSTFALQSLSASPALLAANVLANYALGFAAVVAARHLVTRTHRRWSP